MKPTAEQEAIFECKARILKVSAFAGTGKTTTLRGYASANPGSRILYIAFNKAIQKEAEAKFPGHVTARTAHSIAYGRYGRQYGQVPGKLVGNIKPFHVLPFLRDSTRTMPSSMLNVYGGRVIDAVKSFLVSDDPELVMEHVGMGEGIDERKYFNSNTLLSDARRIWALMCDASSAMPMVHDGYLKLFQLSGTVLPYDIVLLDEAQDTNPVTQAIVERQPGRKVYVGDQHQAIYGFRGAANAMANIKADASFHLTGSFRFGEAVADVANAVLALKDEPRALRGLGGPSSVGILRQRLPHAFIARGNSALFHRAVEALRAGESFAFVGDIRNYRFDLIEDAYRISNGETAKDPFLRSFASFEAMEEYGEALGDKEISGRCRLIAHYGHDIPRLVRQITERALPPVLPGTGQPERSCQVVLSSAHRSKGLEFDYVKLADDFMDVFDEKGQLIDFGRADQQIMEEINLQYVAATRARKTLELGGKLQFYFDYVRAMKARPTAPNPAP